MSQDNKRLARRVLEEIYARAELALADELVHPDFVDHDPGHPEGSKGPEGVRQTVRRLHSVFGDLSAGSLASSRFACDRLAAHQRPCVPATHPYALHDLVPSAISSSTSKVWSPR